MGRNSGDQIMWTHVHDGTNHIFSHYCQQHTRYDQVSNAVSDTAFSTLKKEIRSTDGEHGNVEQ